MTDAGEKMLDLVPGLIGLGVASKFLEKTQGKKKEMFPKNIFNIKK